MDFVDIVLSGRTYRLRFTADDIQDICRRLTPFQPVGGGKVTPPILGGLLVSFDPDAYQFSLWGGMRHIAEYKDITPTDTQKLISLHIKGGGQYTDIRRPIFKTLVACGFADFAPILQMIEEEEVKRAQDGAIDLNALAPEADRGNGSTPGSPSPTPSSTHFSMAERSDSST